MNEYSKAYFMLKKQNLESIIKKEKTVTAVAEEMRVSRQAVHKWLSRYKRFGEEGILPQKRKKKGSPANKTSSILEGLVIGLAEQNWYHGVETLSDMLFDEQEISIHPATIYRILKRTGTRYDHFWEGTKRRRKKQLYAHKEAGKELQMDTKYPFGYKVGRVVYTIIDDASRWSYARVYETANAENTLDFLKRVRSRAPFMIQKIRTDCGTEFVNRKVTEYLLELGIEYRKNTPYCPEENGKIERFHRTLNEKAISLFWSPQDSLETLQYKLSQFLFWYNHKKHHRGLDMNGLTPFQKLLFLSSQSVNLTLQCNKF